MRIGRNAGCVFVCLLMAGIAQADFKYSEKSQVTGGSMVALANTLGKFSKNAQQVNEPQISTVAVKGNRLRREDSKGTVEIIDLDGRRVIHIDDANKSYSVMTFEQMKQAMLRAQEKMKEQQAKMSGQKQPPANVKMIPHLEEQETGAKRDILGIPASERKVKLTMEMVNTDPQAQQQQQPQSGRWVMNADSWIAPLPGYEEINQFYMRMAKEMDWLPGQVLGANVMMSQAMQEFKKNQLKLKGLPLLQTTSFTMAAPPGSQQAQAQQQAQAAQQQQQAQQQKSAAEQAATTMPPTSGKDALTRGIVGGLMGGFGRKKKQQQEQQQQQQAQAQAQSGQTGNPNGGSLMDVTTEVTSFSRAPLDASLFDIPAGYKEVQANPELDTGTAK